MAKLNKTRFAVLGILALESVSGYDIKTKMGRSTDHFWKEGDSSIYPILKQLLAEKLVTCKLENVDSNKPKKVYTITQAGNNELERWLVDDAVILQSRNELMLKVYFGWNVDPAITLSHVAKYQRSIMEKLKVYRALDLAGVTDLKKLERHQLHKYLTIRSGILHAETSLQWCDEVIGILKGMGNNK